MAHSLETKEALRRLYIEGMALSGAAIASAVSYDTARDWKSRAKAKGDDWDTARAAYRISDQGAEDLNKSLVEDFARQIITTIREVESSTLAAPSKVSLLAQLADAYSKFSKGFARINPAFSGLSVALDTLKVLTEHLRAHDKAALGVLQGHFEAVGAVLAKRYG